MNVLSLFDGCAMAYEALKRSGIPVDAYYASEVDRWAMQIASKNHPDIIQLGDIRTVNPFLLPKIDLVIGGSPCQDLSCAGSGAGLNGNRSGLFFDFCRLVEYLNPAWFLLENVASMNKTSRFIISQHMGTEPIMIDSALVSAQTRKRLYWTNIPTGQPKNKSILLSSILTCGVVDRDKSYCIDRNYWKGTHPKHYKKRAVRQLVFDTEKDIMNLNDENYEEIKYRKLFPAECERLQTLPDNYTEGVSNTQRYKMLGNGFTVDVIAHILKGINHG